MMKYDEDESSNTNNINKQVYEPSEKKKKVKRRTKNFSEKREYDLTNIDSIRVNSPISAVNIYQSKSSKLEIEFKGISTFDGDITLDIRRYFNELVITVVHIGEYQNSNLLLNVALPSGKYKSLVAKTGFSGITVSEEIEAVDLELSSKQGDINTKAIFDESHITTEDGDIVFSIKAKNDIIVFLSTTSGNIDADFSNIGYLALKSRSRLGKVVNKHSQDFNFDYTAIVNIFTIGGNVTIT